MLNENKANIKKSGIAWIITQKKIGAREDLIAALNEEIHQLDIESAKQKEAIDSLQNQLVKSREQYEKMIVYAYKNRNSLNNIIFVFSASDFNEAYKRLKYIKKIAEYRTFQAEEIAAAQRAIEGKIAIIEQKKERKKTILGDKYHEKKILLVEKDQSAEIMQNLQKDEKKLRKKIAKKEKESKRLNDQIAKIIQEELRKAREEAARIAREKAKGNGVKPKKVPQIGVPVETKLSKNFELNKGKFPWPVATGVISGRFGITSHPANHELKINNNGINIVTKKGTNATAIFGGNVIAIIVIPSGGKSAVLLQHGAYFTLYSNLVSVKVSKGDEIKIGQQLGTIKTEEDGTTEIHFELWNGGVKQNPALWLRKKP